MPPAGALRLQDEHQVDLWYGCTVAGVDLIIPPPSTRASPADQAHGVKVVQPVGCSTLTPWAWPAPYRAGRRRRDDQPGTCVRWLMKPPSGVPDQVSPRNDSRSLMARRVKM